MKSGNTTVSIERELEFKAPQASNEDQLAVAGEIVTGRRVVVDLVAATAIVIAFEVALSRIALML